MPYLIAILMTLVLGAGSVHASVPTYGDLTEARYYPAEIIRVKDADTMEVRLDLGLGVGMTVDLRIHDYDAPETWRPKTLAEDLHGQAATAYAKEILPDEVVITSYGWAVYNRVEADIFLPDGSNFSEIMISEGYAKADSYEPVF